ncbi:MAG: hypothetical protein H0V29_04570 [Thermoleophilaceae bacterium]|nr:hypothetical protein [Thermoleophilaceae bacterium]
MRLRVTFACLGVAALALGGCGDEAKDRGDSAAEAPPVARAADFPKADGRTLGELKKSLGAGPVLGPASTQLQAGEERFGFALFDRSRKQITEAQTALYAAPIRGQTASSGVVGPFPAKYESLEVKPQFQSQTVKSDPDAAAGVYVSDLKLPKGGNWALMAVARLDERLVASDPIAIESGDFDAPKVGEKAIEISTPTRASVGGDIASIDTREPPSTMHEVDFKDVLGKKPVVLTFATAALCQSRVCGPVIDVTEEVKSKHQKDVEFVHMEIYQDNELDKGFRPQFAKWKLPSEPWTFVIDRDGVVSKRYSGPFSVDELDAAVSKVAEH